ncbi:MAG: GAF domain-containing protein [Anaerolineae bacterium]|nr:GAF domain-containing protein [Anaerolineae bacterium]
MKQFFAPPIFEDQNKTRVASLLNVMLLTILAATVVGTAIVIPLEPGEFVFNLAFGVVLTLLVLWLRWLVRRGRLQFVGTVLSTVLWISITILIYMGNGIRDPIMSGYFLVVIVASLLLGAGGTIAFGALSIAAAVGLLYAETAGLITVSFTESAGIVELMMITAAMVLSVVLLRSAVLKLGDALANAQSTAQALASSNLELREHRDRLVEQTQALERRSNYLQASAQVGRAAASILEVNELINNVVYLMQRRFDLSYSGLFLVDETGDWAVLQAGAGRPNQAMQEHSYRTHLGAGIVGSCISDGKPHFTSDGAAVDAATNTAQPAGEVAEAALPLRSRGQVLGALLLQSTRPETFEPDALTALEATTDHIAVAIDNARLFAASQAALEGVRQAYGDVGKRGWAQLLQVQPNLRYRCDPYGVVTKVTGKPDGAPGMEEEWLQRPELIQAIRDGQSLQLDDATVVTSVRLQDQSLGILRLCKPESAGDWTLEEIRIVEALADQLSAALERARLYQDTQRRAASDRLLAETAGRIRESLDVESTLRSAADAIYKALELDEIVIRLAADIQVESDRPPESWEE